MFTSHSHLLIFLLVLSDAVQQAACDEGHGHEEDDGQAHNGGQNSHTEPEVLVTRESCSAREGRWLIYGCYCQLMHQAIQTFIILQDQKQTHQLVLMEKFAPFSVQISYHFWWLILKKKRFSSVSPLLSIKGMISHAPTGKCSLQAASLWMIF